MKNIYEDAVRTFANALFWMTLLSLVVMDFFSGDNSQFCWDMAKSLGIVWVGFIAFITVVESKRKEMLDKKFRESIMQKEA